MNQQDLEMIKFISIFVIDAHLGNLENIIKDKETEIIDNYKIVDQNMISENIEDDSNEIDLLANTDELKYYNGYGAFSKDGKNSFFISIATKNILVFMVYKQKF